jgi:hypothetical protein
MAIVDTTKQFKFKKARAKIILLQIEGNARIYRIVICDIRYIVLFTVRYICTLDISIVLYKVKLILFQGHIAATRQPVTIKETLTLYI